RRFPKRPRQSRGMTKLLFRRPIFARTKAWHVCDLTATLPNVSMPSGISPKTRREYYSFRKVLAQRSVCNISATVAKNAAAQGPVAPNLSGRKHWLCPVRVERCSGTTPLDHGGKHEQQDDEV